jgi:hypothetical protein
MLRRLTALSILTAACLLLMAMAGAERAEAFIADSGDALVVSVCSALFWYAVALRRGA